jgi:hypothetical protein
MQCFSLTCRTWKFMRIDGRFSQQQPLKISPTHLPDSGRLQLPAVPVQVMLWVPLLLHGLMEPPLTLSFSAQGDSHKSLDSCEVGMSSDWDWLSASEFFLQPWLKKTEKFLHMSLENQNIFPGDHFRGLQNARLLKTLQLLHPFLSIYPIISYHLSFEF